MYMYVSETRGNRNQTGLKIFKPKKKEKIEPQYIYTARCCSCLNLEFSLNCFYLLSFKGRKARKNLQQRYRNDGIRPNGTGIQRLF